MTKKQKTARILLLKEVVEKHGFSVDSWGNYKLVTDTGKQYRIKFMTINIRFEWKSGKHGSIWFNIFSKPIATVSPDSLDYFLNRRLN